MTEALLAKLSEDWPIFSLLALILIKLFQSQIISFLPAAVQGHLKTKAKLRADRQEHEQEIQIAERNLIRLRELNELSKDSFTAEQLTALTSELQVQAETANDFIRRMVSDKLDILIENQRFILQELRRNGNGRNGNGKTNRLEAE